MFNRGESVLLACHLGRSGFDSERIFLVGQPDRSEHVGAAPVHYCWTDQGARLGKDLPARGHRISGLIQGYVISNGGHLAKIETPDGETVVVETSSVKRFEDVHSWEPYQDVPVGS